MKKVLKVLQLQFQSVLGDKQANFKKVSKLLKENADFEPDLVILPEVWTTGCDYENFQNSAEFIPAQTTMLLSGLAESYNTNIIGGSFIEKTFDGKFYNSSVVIGRNGAVLGQYRKTHLFSHHGSLEKKYLNNGEETCVIDVEGVKFGIAICYDIRFPELFRKMVNQGAEVFVVPAAFPQERITQWNILNQARALENQAFLISCNSFGSSNLVSPTGEILQTSDENETVIRNIINMDEVKNFRENAPYLKDIF